jgi:hypothetical protein
MKNNERMLNRLLYLEKNTMTEWIVKLTNRLKITTMEPINLRTKGTLSSIRADFKKAKQKEPENVPPIEYIDFAVESLVEKFVTVFDELTKYNGKLERKIEKLEKKIDSKKK